MIKDKIAKLSCGESLGREEARDTVKEILAGEVSDAAIAGLLVALKMKGESYEEITGFALGLRDMAVKINPKSRPLVDTCGTGGDRKGTFNVSTAAAFLVAGAGVAVAKHGNRSVSSSCGSADVLSELGVKIDMSPRRAEMCIDGAGIGFLFAPTFHPAMKRVMSARKSLGIPTIFNILGPLANPAGARAHVLGVNSPQLVAVIGEALGRIGVDRAFVVHGRDGMDELTITDETYVCEVEGNRRKEYSIDPGRVGLETCRPEELLGGEAPENARSMRDVLGAKEGPMLEVSVGNAALALLAAGRVSSIDEGIELARDSARTGRAALRLEALIEISNRGGEKGVP